MNFSNPKFFLYILSFLFLFHASSAQTEHSILPSDLQLVLGQWTGSLTYLDYKTGKPYTMLANVDVTKNGNKIVLKNSFPKEPEANNTSRIRIRKNGTSLNNETVVSRKELADNTIEIKTEQKGKDDMKPAIIRQTYVLSKTSFVMIKEVQFESSDAWIKRNEFNYKRK